MFFDSWRRHFSLFFINSRCLSSCFSQKHLEIVFTPRINRLLLTSSTFLSFSSSSSSFNEQLFSLFLEENWAQESPVSNPDGQIAVFPWFSSAQCWQEVKFGNKYIINRRWLCFLQLFDPQTSKRGGVRASLRGWGQSSCWRK